MKTFVAVLSLAMVAFSGAEEILNCANAIPLVNGTLVLANSLEQPKECNVIPENIRYFYFYKNISIEFKRGEQPFLLYGAPNCSLRLYCHGWLPLNQSSEHILKAWISNGYQVVFFYWGYYAATMHYLVARSCVAAVALEMAKFLATIPEELLECLIMCGFSLGAHICGMASALTDSKPFRIDALDPPTILFDDSGLIPLNKTNAQCVVVYQTSVLSCNQTGGGSHVIVNGGSNQPGCIPGAGIFCDHNYANTFRMSTVNKSLNQYVATRCDSSFSYYSGKCTNNAKIIVGEYFNQSLCGQEGKYYVKTYPSIFPFFPGLFSL